jgi:hypothetical protein
MKKSAMRFPNNNKIFVVILTLINVTFVAACLYSNNGKWEVDQKWLGSSAENKELTDNSSMTLDFTYEDAVGDYRFFSSLLDESYPFCSVVERRYGVKISDIESKFFTGLNEHQKDMSIEIFTELLDETVRSFQSVGGICLVDSRLYKDYLESYQDILSDDTL